MNFIDLFDRFPDERSARQWLEDIRLARRQQTLPLLCRTTHLPRPERTAPALQMFPTAESTSASVPDMVMQNSKVSLRKWVIAILPAFHRPKRNVQHRSSPRPRRYPEDRLVHGAENPGRLEPGHREAVWPNRGRRTLYRWQGEEQARQEEAVRRSRLGSARFPSSVSRKEKGPSLLCPLPTSTRIPSPDLSEEQSCREKLSIPTRTPATTPCTCISTMTS